jgi:HNH endonuclease
LKTGIELQDLKDQLRYDPDTGDFVWLAPDHGRTVGVPIGESSTSMYLVITFNGIKVSSNVLAWYYMTGEWPPHGFVVTRVDGNTRNDKWSNLKLITERAMILQRRDAMPQEAPPPPMVRERARFTNRAVGEAVEAFMRGKVLVDGRYT